MKNLFFYDTYDTDTLLPYLYAMHHSCEKSLKKEFNHASVPLSQMLDYSLGILSTWHFFDSITNAIEQTTLSFIGTQELKERYLKLSTREKIKYPILGKLYEIFKSESYWQELKDLIVLYQNYESSKVPPDKRIKNSSDIIKLYLGNLGRRKGAASPRAFTDKVSAIRKNNNDSVESGSLILPAFIEEIYADGQKKKNPLLKISSPLDIEILCNLFQSATPSYNPFIQSKKPHKRFSLERFLNVFSHITLSSENFYISTDELKKYNRNMSEMNFAVHNQYTLERLGNFNFILAFYYLKHDFDSKLRSLYQDMSSSSGISAAPKRWFALKKLSSTLMRFVDFPLPNTRLRILKCASEYLASPLDNTGNFIEQLADLLTTIRHYHLYLLFPVLKVIADECFQYYDGMETDYPDYFNGLLKRIHYFDTDTSNPKGIPHIHPIAYKSIIPKEIEPLEFLSSDKKENLNDIAYTLYYVFSHDSERHGNTVLNNHYLNRITYSDYLSWLLSKIDSQIEESKTISLIKTHY